MKFRLPYPPTVNHYQGKRVVLPPAAELGRVALSMGASGLSAWLRERCFVQVYDKQEAKDYKWLVRAAVGVVQPLECPVHISMTVLPPDRRKRDADNVFKCVFDALQFSRVVVNDSQFKRGTWEFGEPVEGGAIIVEVEPLAEAQQVLV